MHRSSPTKPLPSSIPQSYPISNTPPVLENFHLLPLVIIYVLVLLIFFPLATPNHLHCLPLHSSIILLFLIILIVTIPLLIPRTQCMAINPNYFPPLHHQL